MQTVTLHVRPKFHQEYGASVTVTPVQALALARKGVVNLSQPKYQTCELAADTPETPRRKRRYRRRDMTAED